MSGETNEPSVREQRVNEVIAAYLEAADAGEVPDPKEFIAAHGDIAAELESFFANRDEFDRMAEPLQPKGADAPQPQPDDVTLPPASEPTEAPTLAPSETAGVAIGMMVRYFGDYELLDEIARGGMGVVYKARQVTLNRIVALKMILAGQLAGEEDVQRFHAEAEAAANLDHPGIVPIFEVGEHEGQHYFSMGFVEGCSLSAKVADGPLPPKEAAEYTKKVAEAVAFAHEHGVIHRDLKPANVLLDANDEPKVTDFGLAKKVEGDEGLTATGQILGTPGYMPPEQASGKIDEVTETADVYSLGAILYCLLTARPPFQADNPLDTLMQVLEREPVSPRTLNPKVLQDLETICLKCLEKDRYRRYRSAQELVDELERFLNGKPIVARPISAPARAWRWCKRKPVVAGLIAAVAVSLLAGFAVSTHFAVEATRRAAEAVKSANQATDEKLRADEERDRANARLYVADVQLADRAWQKRRILRMQSLLDAHQPQSGQPDLRGWEWFYLRGLCFGAQNTFRGHTSYVGCVAWSPDGERLASSSKDGSVKIWSAGRAAPPISMPRGWEEECTLAWTSDGTRLLVTPAAFLYQTAGQPEKLRVLAWGAESGRTLLSAEARMGAWDPGGEHVAHVGQDGKLRIWKAASGGTAEISPGLGPLSCLAWSPDGNQCAVGCKSGNVTCLDVASGEAAVKLDVGSFPVTMVHWSPDGEQIATAGGSRSVKLWQASNGQLLWSFPMNPEQMAWSPDSRRLVTVQPQAVTDGFRGAIKVWNATDGKEVRSFPGTAAAWSPDASYLATAHRSGSIVVRHVEDWRQSHTFDGHTADALCLAWRSDSQQLASAASDQTVRTWNLVEDTPITAIPGVRSVAWSPDGRLLAAHQPDGTVGVFDSETGAETAKFEGHAARPTALAWSRTSGYLASASYYDTKKTGDVVLFDAHTGKLVRKFPALKGTKHMVWSSDGERLAVCDPSFRNQTVKIIQVKDGRTCLSVRGRVVAWSRDGQRLATAGGGSGDRSTWSDIRVWDAATGTLIRSLSGHSQTAHSLAFSSDDRHLASGAFDPSTQTGKIILWSLETGEAIHELVGHDGLVAALAWNANSNRLASIGGRQLILWDTSLGQELLAIDVDSRRATFVAWSPDGRRLATAGYDPTIRIWDAGPGHQHAKPLPTDYFQAVYRVGGVF